MWMQASAWAAKASLSSIRSMSVELQAGPLEGLLRGRHGAGAHHARVDAGDGRGPHLHQRLQAQRLWPSRRYIISSAAAPSLSGELLPAVTVPILGMNAGSSAASASRLVSGRTHWSPVDENAVARFVAAPDGDDLAL